MESESIKSIGEKSEELHKTIELIKIELKKDEVDLNIVRDLVNKASINSVSVYGLLKYREEF